MSNAWRRIVSTWAASVLLAWSAPSAALVFNLDCIISGAGCAPSASYGTVTLTDNGNDVTISVDLVGDDIQKVLAVVLNYDDSIFGPGDDFGTTNDTSPPPGDTNGVLENENGITADGYPGRLDLQIPESGSLEPGNVEPFVDNITLASFNLDPTHFDFTDTLDAIFAAVHIGQCGPDEPAVCLPGTGGDNSIWVGSLTSENGGGPPTGIPEPRAISLLALGLMGLGYVARRRSRR